MYLKLGLDLGGFGGGGGGGGIGIGVGITIGFGFGFGFGGLKKFLICDATLRGGGGGGGRRIGGALLPRAPSFIVPLHFINIKIPTNNITIIVRLTILVVDTFNFM